MKDKKFKFFDEINTSDELRQKVLNKTINCEEVKVSKYCKMPKLVYVFSVCLLVSLFSCTVVLAVSYYQECKLEVNVDEDGNSFQSIVLEEPALINDVIDFTCSSGDSLFEIGEVLGIEFSTSDKYNNVISGCDVTLNDEGHIESVLLFISDYADYSDENSKIEGFDNETTIGWFKGTHIGLSIAFITDYASDEVKEELSDLFSVSSDWMGEEMNVHQVTFDELGVIANYYRPIRQDSDRWFTYVVFVQDNILYSFEGFRVSVDEVIDVIE